MAIVNRRVCRDEKGRFKKMGVTKKGKKVCRDSKGKFKKMSIIKVRTPGTLRLPLPYGAGWDKNTMSGLSFTPTGPRGILSKEARVPNTKIPIITVTPPRKQRSGPLPPKKKKNGKK